MDEITKMGSIEAATAICDYDPTDPENLLSGDLVDVICLLWKLTVKVCGLRSSLLCFLIEFSKRFRLQVNASNISNGYNPIARFRLRWRYPSPVRHVGGRYMACSITA